jgi:hypothetical protein
MHSPKTGASNITTGNTDTNDKFLNINSNITVKINQNTNAQ